MNANSQQLINSSLTAAYLLCSAAFLAIIAFHNIQLIQYPLPLSYIEPAISTVTDYIGSGGNPYALEAQPNRISVYPVLYNILAVPVSEIFGNTLEMHRALTAVFLITCCALFYAATYFLSRSHSDTLAATAIFYCGLMVYSTPIASPNGIGLLLFLGALLIPVLDKFSLRSLAASIILGVMAFHAKQYFVASLGFVALYLFLAVGKRQGIYFGGISLVIFLVSLAVILPGSPYYLDSLIFAVSGASDLASDNKFMWRQWADYWPIAWPLLVIIGAGLIQFWTSPRSKLESEGIKSTPVLNLRHWREPLFNHCAGAIWIFLACSTFIFVFSLGRNPGNDLTYLFQIISPFALTLSAIAISKASWQKWPMRILMLIAFSSHYHALSHDFSVENEDEWFELQSVIAQADSVYATTFLLEQLVHQGKEIHNNGHTNYFQTAKSKPSFLKRKAPRESIDALWQASVEDVHAEVKSQAFDLVVIDNWTRLPDLVAADGSTVEGKKLLLKYYRPARELKITLANRPGGGSHRVKIWEPRPKR